MRQLAGHLESDGKLPAPWVWELCQHCMNLQDGTFVHWPVAGDWRANAFYLRLMRGVWRVLAFKRRTANERYEWTSEDVDFEAWLMRDEG